MNALTDFWNALVNELQNGLFYFNGPWEIFVTISDIAVTTFLIYFLLKLISETQAWQLLKGIIAVIIFMIIGGFLGLKTINYILVNFASVFVIALIVVFQPEMRRALEAVGRKSSNIFSASGEKGSESENQIKSTVESIVEACEEMAKTKTGALIIIERETKLGDLIESGAVVIDAELSSTMLRQIFYVNSPMHDGAVIIRDGRIYATRVHVPLGESYSLKREYGTRHRAAIGASEIGDTISVVVSEEHGTISIAVYGRLYTLDDADSLRIILNKLLDPNNNDASSVPSKLRKILRIDRNERSANQQIQSDDDKDAIGEIVDNDDVSAKKVYGGGQEVTNKPHIKRAGIMLSSVLVAVAFWLYVRVTTNPVIQKTYSVPLQTIGVENLYEQQLDYYMGQSEVKVFIKGREQMLEDLPESNIDAVVDLSGVQGTGTFNLPVSVELKDTSKMAYTASREPTEVSVIINQVQVGSSEQESTNPDASNQDEQDKESEEGSSETEPSQDSEKENNQEN